MIDDESIFSDFNFQGFSEESELAGVTRSIGNELLASYANKSPNIHNHKAALDFYKLLAKFYSSVRLYEKGKELSSPLQWPIDPYQYQPAFMFSWSDAERQAWQIIRGSALCFFPQWPELSGIQKEPFTHYFLDFANPWIKVAIEIDGSQHLSAHVQKKDRRRDKRLLDLGYTVYRIPTTAIYNREPHVDDTFFDILDGAYGEPGYDTFRQYRGEISDFYFSRFEGFMSCLRRHLTGEAMNSDIARALGFDDPIDLQNEVLSSFESASRL